MNTWALPGKPKAWGSIPSAAKEKRQSCYYSSDIPGRGIFQAMGVMLKPRAGDRVPQLSSSAEVSGGK